MKGALADSADGYVPQQSHFPPPLQADEQKVLGPSFLVVEVDVGAGQLRIAQREGDGWGPNMGVWDFTATSTRSAMGVSLFNSNAKGISAKMKSSMIEPEPVGSNDPLLEAIIGF